MDKWREIPDFPGYSVSVEGEVRNDRTGLLLARSVVARGVYVGMSRDRVQHNRMVSRLVADAFLEPPPLPYQREVFDTPINRDGDRCNNHLDNLEWRPRWFAVKYHQQFRVDWTDGPRIREVVTRERFTNVLDAAVMYGVLALEVIEEAMNHGVYGFDDYGVWPHHIHFEVIHNNTRRNRRV